MARTTQRVNITQAARLTGRSEKTIRTWLAEEPVQLSVELGPIHGGRRDEGTGQVKKGRTRLLDVDELRQVHEAHGGTEWNTSCLPRADERSYAPELEELRGRLIWMERALAQLSAMRSWEAGYPEPLQVLGTPAEREIALGLARCTPEQQQMARQFVALLVASNTPHGPTPNH